MIYITSDLHFSHDKSFLYVPRGYKNIWEHDSDIVQRWNETVSMNDEVYVLGDLMLNSNENGRKLLSQLKGNLHLIYGNHDSDVRKDIYKTLWNVVEICGYATVIKDGKWRFYLSHYPTMTTNYDDNDKPLRDRMWNLCGHTHTSDKYLEMRKGLLSYHCELDAHDNRPVSIEEIKQDIKNFYDAV